MLPRLHGAPDWVVSTAESAWKRQPANSEAREATLSVDCRGSDPLNVVSHVHRTYRSWRRCLLPLLGHLASHAPASAYTKWATRNGRSMDSRFPPANGQRLHACDGRHCDRDDDDRDDSHGWPSRASLLVLVLVALRRGVVLRILRASGTFRRPTSAPPPRGGGRVRGGMRRGIDGRTGI